MTFRTASALSALSLLSLLSVGCATKKHVREAIAPVQDQVNKTQNRVTDLQKQIAENEQAIGDLDRQIATTDEKATEAGKKAAEAANAAAKASSAAADAGRRADAASSLAQQAQQGVVNLDRSLQNLDNYKLATTQQVYFDVNKSMLTKEEQAKLNRVVQKVGGMRNFIIEVEGYADRSGDMAHNRELSRKRADAVLHYLTVEHSIPLRSIHELGVGSDFPNADNKTRAARKQNRRVDVKIYVLDLKRQTSAGLDRR